MIGGRFARACARGATGSAILHADGKLRGCEGGGAGGPRPPTTFGVALGVGSACPTCLEALCHGAAELLLAARRSWCGNLEDTYAGNAHGGGGDRGCSGVSV